MTDAVTAYPNLRPFQKGQSGNPKGRPKGASALRHAAQQYGPGSLAVLWDLAQNGKNELARKAAATELLDRGYGRPMSELEWADYAAQYGSSGMVLENEDAQQLIAIKFIQPADTKPKAD